MVVATRCLALGLLLVSAGCQEPYDSIANASKQPIEVRVGLGTPSERSYRLGPGDHKILQRRELEIAPFLVTAGRCRYSYQIDRATVVGAWEGIRAKLLDGDVSGEIDLDKTLSARVTSNPSITVQPYLYFGMSERGKQVTAERLRVRVRPKAVECDR